MAHAESYTIHNPRYGEIRDDVTSPYSWDGLTNGELYSFQLQAVLPEGAGEDAWSTMEDVIPICARTLTPSVVATDYRSISLGWDAIPAASEYIVERSVDGGPVEQDKILSAVISASPGRFPTEGATRAGGYNTDGRAPGVTVSGSYASRCRQRRRAYGGGPLARVSMSTRVRALMWRIGVVLISGIFALVRRFCFTPFEQALATQVSDAAARLISHGILGHGKYR